MLLWLIRRTPRTARLQQLAFGLLCAGSAGNLADNLFNLDPGHEHSVRDFLHIAGRGFALPAFNLADVWVTAGALAFFLVLLGVRHSSHRLRRPGSSPW